MRKKIANLSPKQAGNLNFCLGMDYIQHYDTVSDFTIGHIVQKLKLVQNVADKLLTETGRFSPIVPILKELQ